MPYPLKETATVRVAHPKRAARRSAAWVRRSRSTSDTSFFRATCASAAVACSSDRAYRGKPCPTPLDSRRFTATSGESDPNLFEPDFRALASKVACRLKLSPTRPEGFESLPLRCCLWPPVLPLEDGSNSNSTFECDELQPTQCAGCRVR